MVQEMNWKYSEWEDPKAIPFTTGMRTLFICDAIYDEDNERYTITFSDMETGAQFDVRYFLTYNGQPSSRTLATLQTLKRALVGPGATKGLLHPSVIVGGVVCADVKEKILNNDHQTRVANIYSFQPVVQDLAMMATIDQYYVGKEYEAQE